MTAQFYENLLYNGEEFSMAEVPFQYYLKNNNITIPGTDPHFGSSCSACWRGYVGSWEIKNDKLFLISLRILDDDEISLNYFFPYMKEVFAEWYSGEIRIPCGEMLEYEHHGFGSVYEKDLFLVIENGILVKEYEVDNNTEELQERLKEKEQKENEKLAKQKKVDKIFELISIIILLLVFTGICIGIFYLIKWGTILAYVILTPIVIGIIYLIYIAIKNRIKPKTLNNNKQNRKKAVKFYEEGLQYINQKNFDAAEDCFKKGVVEDNTYSMCLNGCGAILIQRNNFIKAIDYLEKALHYDPNNIKILLNFGLLFSKKGEVELALSYYEKVISADSSNQIAINQKLKLTNALSISDILKENTQNLQSFISSVSNKCSHKVLHVSCEYCSQTNSTINNKLDSALKLWLNLLESYELRYLNNTELIKLINHIVCNLNNLSSIYPPDIFNYPLKNWNVEKINLILYKMLFYCKGFTLERYFEEKEEIVNIRETMEYLYYTYSKYETTSIENIYRLNFVHKIHKDTFSIYCYSDNIDILKELPFYFNIMPFGIEQNGTKVPMKLQNDIIKPITSISILGIEAEHSYMNQFYPNKHFIQKLTEYKSNDQTFKVDILTTVDDDNVIFDISEFFGK